MRDQRGLHATEIGLIPEDWDVVPLSDLFEFRNGFNTDKSAYGRGVPFVNILEVITRSHLHVGDIPGLVDVPAGAGERFSVRCGDVLFNRTSETQEEVGLAAVYLDETNVVFGGFVIRGRPRAESPLQSQFAGYALRSAIVRTQMVARGQGAIHANIGQVDLGRVRLPVPGKDEQRAIADVLDDSEQATSTLRILIDKKRQLRVAVARQLLMGELRLPGFDDEWSPASLGQLGPFSKGTGVRKDQVSAEGLPCLRYGEIYTHHVDRVRIFNSFISRSVAAESHRLSEGDLLFAGSGETSEEIGKCVVYLGDGEAYAGSDIVILSPVRDDPLFLAYLLNQEPAARQKMRLGQGDAVVHIGARALAQIELSLPSVDEQRAISELISDVDDEILTLEAQFAKVTDVKTGMSQELLSGRTRLV
jgi:type I restriction enzyme S subunit